MHHGDVSPEIAAGLLALRKRIAAAKIPPSKLDETINVAMWNIREFGKKRRTNAAIHYVAQLNPVRTVSLPELWIGLAAAAAMLAAAVWLRRRREPI